MRIPRVQNIGAFRRAVIALLLLCSNRLGSKRHFVRLYYLTVAQKLQSSLVLDDNYLVNGGERVVRPGQNRNEGRADAGEEDERARPESLLALSRWQ